MISRIVTHPGSAHKDDLLAVCLLVAKYGVPVARHTPTPAELADPSVCVVDVGDDFDLERMNLDHHQFPIEDAPTCSISLVLKHLGLYEDARLLCGWLETSEWLDVRGPQKTAEWLGVGADVLSRLSSPIDLALLRRFGQSTALAPGEPLYEMLRLVGEELIEHLTSTRGRIDFIAKHALLWKLEVRGRAFEALFVPRTEPLPPDPSGDADHYVRTSGLRGRVVATIYPDRRSTGFGMARFDDHPDVDFCRVGAEPDVHFVHKSGFLCKTSATSPERLQELLRAAWK